jgi:CIC family chloride channel protein
LYFGKVYFSIFKWFNTFKNKAVQMLVGGVVLGFLIFLAPALYGEGYEVINSLLQQNYLQALGNNFFNDYLDQQLYIILFLVVVFIFKSIATSVTIAAGGVGGIFAPVLFMGSTMGNAFALLVNSLGFKQISVTNFTLVGMAGLMAGIMHAPLTAIFLIAEITSGYGLFIPLMITAGISFFITSQIQPHSVYTIELAQRGDLLTHNKDQTVLTLMDIRQEIETNFISLNINYNLGEIVKIGVVNSSRNIFPVVDENNIFKGVILLDDIRTIMFDKSLYEEVKVIDIMQQAPEVIDLNNCSMKDIMQKFQQSDAWNLPVVENEVYKGFVSKSKLLTAYRQKLIELSV